MLQAYRRPGRDPLTCRLSLSEADGMVVLTITAAGDPAAFDPPGDSISLSLIDGYVRQTSGHREDESGPDGVLTVRAPLP